MVQESEGGGTAREREEKGKEDERGGRQKKNV